MGIEPEPDIGNNCLACFPAGKAPQFVYMSFVGIEKGAAWVPGDPEPPNSTYQLHQIAACHWYAHIGTFELDYFSHLPGTRIKAQIPLGWNAFQYDSVVSCKRSGWNHVVEPPNQKFTWGTVQVTWIT